MKFKPSNIQQYLCFAEKNAAPVARIVGGNQNLTLPLSVLVLNGSSSYDDLAIVNFSWTRESDSLAVGNIIGNSNHEPALMVKKRLKESLDRVYESKLFFQLSGVVAGNYTFKLTVADEQGLTGFEIVTVSVYEDPMIMNLVEVVLTAKASSLSQQEVSFFTNNRIFYLNNSRSLLVGSVKTKTAAASWRQCYTQYSPYFH